jgi:hypothetical protein
MVVKAKSSTKAAGSIVVVKAPYVNSCVQVFERRCPDSRVWGKDISTMWIINLQYKPLETLLLYASYLE